MTNSMFYSWIYWQVNASGLNPEAMNDLTWYCFYMPDYPHC